MVQVILRKERLLCEFRRAYVSVDVHDMRSPTRLNSCTALVYTVYAPTKSDNEEEPNCLSQLCR